MYWTGCKRGIALSAPTVTWRYTPLRFGELRDTRFVLQVAGESLTASYARARLVEAGIDGPRAKRRLGNFGSSATGYVEVRNNGAKPVEKRWTPQHTPQRPQSAAEEIEMLRDLYTRVHGLGAATEREEWGDFFPVFRSHLRSWVSSAAPPLAGCVPVPFCSGWPLSSAFSSLVGCSGTLEGRAMHNGSGRGDRKRAENK